MAQFEIKCARCGERAVRASSQAKYCLACKKKIKASFTPPGLAEEKRRLIRSLKDRFSMAQIAHTVGVSKTTIARVGREEGFSFQGSDNRKWAKVPGLYEKICRAYERHGLKKTQELFPNVRVRSIVEWRRKRERLKPRVTKWTSEQLMKSVRLTGFVAQKNQGELLGRPRYSAAARWTWNGGCSRYLNGLVLGVAAPFVGQDCPVLVLSKTRLVILWVDLEEHLREDVPGEIKILVRTMAKMQRWIFGTRDVQRAVRELLGGDKWHQRKFRSFKAQRLKSSS